MQNVVVQDIVVRINRVMLIMVGVVDVELATYFAAIVRMAAIGDGSIFTDMKITKIMMPLSILNPRCVVIKSGQ